MSIKVMSWVFENGPSDPSERLVLLALADYASDSGEWAPSMIGIAAKAGMTERGARGVIRRLEAGGWIAVKVGGGRGGRSQYRVLMDRENPEPETRNDKPGMTNPEQNDHKPGTKRPETRNQRSAVPSGTIKEPSKEEETPASVLEPFAGKEAVASFIAYRRKSKAGALTLTGARRLSEQLREINTRGGDAADALGLAEERGWRTCKAEWYLNEVQNGNGNRKSPADDPTLRAIARAASRFDA